MWCCIVIEMVCCTVVGAFGLMAQHKNSLRWLGAYYVLALIQISALLAYVLGAMYGSTHALLLFLAFPGCDCDDLSGILIWN